MIDHGAILKAVELIAPFQVYKSSSAHWTFAYLEENTSRIT